MAFPRIQASVFDSGVAFRKDFRSSSPGSTTPIARTSSILEYLEHQVGPHPGPSKLPYTFKHPAMAADDDGMYLPL